MPTPNGWTPVDESTANAWKPVDEPVAPTKAAAAPPPTMLQKVLGGAQDLAKGVGEGALNTISGSDEWARKNLPAFMTNSNFGFGPPANLQHVKELATPANTTQRIGKGLEQAGEFLIPGGAEEAAAARLAPTIGKVGAKLATSALGSGIINKAQGGSFAGGAGAGAAGAGIGLGLKAIAPSLAETALRARGTDRAYEANPGLAILDETKGLKPKSILNSGRGVNDSLIADRNAIAAKSPDVSLAAPRLVARDAASTASLQNEPLGIRKTGDLNNLLTFEGDTSARIPEQVSMPRALQLRTGLGSLKNSWNPNTPTPFADAATGQGYRALTNEIHATSPEIGQIDKRIHSLAPVLDRAGAADLNAGLLQRVLGRFATPTGALVGAAAGAHFGGIPGAVAGTVLPELLTNPTTIMGASRAAYSPITRNIIIPAATGLGMQLDRTTSK